MSPAKLPDELLPKLMKKPPLMVFVQVKPEKPMQGWPQAAGGWVTLANFKALGGWSLDLDPDSIMAIEKANKVIQSWIEDHPKEIWHYRVLHVEDLGVLPPVKQKKKRAKKK
jgi:hypothetical protein